MAVSPYGPALAFSALGSAIGEGLTGALKGQEMADERRLRLLQEQLLGGQISQLPLQQRRLTAEAARLERPWQVQTSVDATSGIMTVRHPDGQVSYVQDTPQRLAAMQKEQPPPGDVASALAWYQKWMPDKAPAMYNAIARERGFTQRAEIAAEARKSTDALRAEVAREGIAARTQSSHEATLQREQSSKNHLAAIQAIAAMNREKAGVSAAVRAQEHAIDSQIGVLKQQLSVASMTGKPTEPIIAEINKLIEKRERLTQSLLEAAPGAPQPAAPTPPLSIIPSAPPWAGGRKPNG